MARKEPRGLTRRSFVRGAALGAAGLAASGSASADAPGDSKAPKLSKVAQAQMEALLAGPGKNFTEEQKKDVARLLAAAEAGSAKLHAFPLEDNSEPAVVFRVYRKEGNSHGA